MGLMQEATVGQTLGGWGLVILSASLTAAGNLLIKQARLVEEGFLSPFFLSGLLCCGINVMVFSFALDRLPLSQAYPVFASLGFILVALCSLFLFQEALSVKQWLGIAFVLIGIGCIATSR